MARTADPQRAAARREAITRAAAELFATRGFEKTTTADIARAAGISAGSVFYHFADKRAVFRSVFERDLPASRALVERHRDSGSPLEAVLAIVDELASPARDPNAAGLLVELLRQVDRDPELQHVIAANAAILDEGLAALVGRGIAEGEIDAALEPREAARWIQVVVDAAFLNADPSRDPRPMLRRITVGFLAAGRGPRT